MPKRNKKLTPSDALYTRADIKPGHRRARPQTSKDFAAILLEDERVEWVEIIVDLPHSTGVVYFRIKIAPDAPNGDTLDWAQQRLSLNRPAGMLFRARLFEPFYNKRYDV